MSDTIDRGAPDWRLIAGGPDPVTLEFSPLDTPDEDPEFDPYEDD